MDDSTKIVTLGKDYFKPPVRKDAKGSDEYPQGDGKPDCPECRGRGVVRVVPAPGTYFGPPRTQVCKCVWNREILQYLEARWPGITRSTIPKASHLDGMLSESIWLTGSDKAMQGHIFRALIKYAKDNGRHAQFQMVTDIDLVDSWLGNVPTDDLRDSDVVLQRERGAIENREEVNLAALVRDTPLLIIRTGFKASKNKEMPAVLLETLKYREARNKPVWFTDTLANPFEHGHIAWSGAAADCLADFGRIILSELPQGVTPMNAEPTRTIQPQQAQQATRNELDDVKTEKAYKPSKTFKKSNLPAGWEG